MKVYLNDLSCGGTDLRLADNFSSVNRFFDLIDRLKDFGVNIVIVAGKFNGLRLCDTTVAECLYRDEFFDQWNLLLQIYNYVRENADTDPAHVFSHAASRRDSVLLGNAHFQSSPAISFVFDRLFATSELTGTKDGQPAVIQNFYDKGQAIDITALVTRADCRPYDPTVTPLWNTEATKAFHATIEPELAGIMAHPKEKIAVLSRCADTIALLNGWEHDEAVTKRNRKNNAYRRIYRAAKFTKTAYLSIDFEKPEVFFELHDKRGRHIGEYLWDGTRSKGPDPDGTHDIDTR